MLTREKAIRFKLIFELFCKYPLQLYSTANRRMWQSSYCPVFVQTEQVFVESVNAACHRHKHVIDTNMKHILDLPTRYVILHVTLPLSSTSLICEQRKF